MYFYLIYNFNDDRVDAAKKIGITVRHPNNRLKEHRTTDVFMRYYKVIQLDLPHNNKQTLLLLEKECKSITIKYARQLHINPNTECRYNIDKDELWKLCTNIIQKYNNVEIKIDQHGEVVLPMADDLEEVEEIKYTSHELYQSYDLINKCTFPYQLRDYQIDAYHKICEMYLQKQSPVNLHILCRCGKSILFSKFAYEYINDFDSVIYVTNRLSLIGDMHKRMKKIFGEMMHFIEVSSNDTDINVNDDKLLILTEDFKKMFIFACNESFHRLEGLLVTYNKCLIIFDEVHYLCTNLHNAHPFKILNEMKNNHFIMTSTATPKFGRYEICNNKVFCNDPKYFGNYPAITYFDIQDAENKKFICPIKLISKKFDANNHPVDNAIALLKHMLTILPKQAQPKKILAYTNSIARINDSYDKIIKDPTFINWHIYKVSSKNTKKNNIEQLNNFINDDNQSILINCQMLSAGINVDVLDCILFIDEKSQKDEIVQIIFRPRNYISQKTAYILIPVIKPKSNAIVYADSTIMVILQELYKYNDPSVVKSIQSNESWQNRLNHFGGMKNLDLNQHFIDDDIKIDIIDINKENLIKQRTLPDMIVDTLKDEIPRTARQIWDEIKNSGYIPPKMGKTPDQTCNAQAHSLSSKGIIAVDKTSRPNKFFKINPLDTNVKIENETN